MKTILLIFLSAICFHGSTISYHAKADTHPAILKCYGRTPCAACTSCSSCAYCMSGGTCGICASGKKKQTVVAAPVSMQCKAITKKGTRCSRAARSNGYCWQHGG